MLIEWKIKIKRREIKAFLIENVVFVKRESRTEKFFRM